MSQGLALEARGLTKMFGDFRALNGVSLEIYPGECFGLLGPNGAGKSTTLKMIYGHTMPTTGELFVMGMNVRDSGREIRARMGVLPQDEGLDNELTVLENLLVFSRYFGIDPAIAKSRALDLLKMIRLDERLDYPVENLSGGYRRRLALARSLVNHPDLLILDEPTVGLDPQVRHWIWGFVQKIKEQQKTVILTTHYMEEAEYLCDRLAIMDQGKILAIGTPRELVDKHLGAFVVEFEAGPDEIGYFLNRLKEKGLRYFVVSDQVYVPFNDENSARQMVDQIKSRRIALRKGTLSDVFLSLAGHDLSEGQGEESW